MDYPKDTPYREDYIIRELDPATVSGDRFQGIVAKTNASITKYNCKDAAEVRVFIDEYIRLRKNPDPYA